MKNIVLFDMDGTLTESRKKIEISTIKKLKKLSKHCEIGIVTGSPLSYLIEQCEDIWKNNKTLSKKITLLPCNGTQRYKFDGENFTCRNKNSLKKEIGNAQYQKIINCILLIQFKITEEIKNLNLTGNFISYRESILNWCPIGRDSGISEREDFIILDEREKIRRKLQDRINLLLLSRDIKNINVTLGGETSLDLYPLGWDKTYCLKYFSKHKVWFIGDKCFGDGNDRHLFEALKEHQTSFSTTGPKHTAELIDNIIEIFSDSDKK